MTCIIVEGPDGAGKTTLINQLIDMYPILEVTPRASSSVEGPVLNLSGWTKNHLWSLEHSSQLTILDRHPLISEPIYGPIIRNTLPQHFSSPTWLERQTERLSKKSVVVWCLPPFNTVFENIKKKPQMEGVIHNIRRIWGAYHRAAALWPRQSVFYDYTRSASFSQGVVCLVDYVIYNLNNSGDESWT